MTTYTSPEVEKRRLIMEWRCCDWCDRLLETPARMGMKGEQAERFGRAMIESDVLAREMMRQMLAEKAMGENENDDDDNDKRHDE